MRGVTMGRRGLLGGLLAAGATDVLSTRVLAAGNDSPKVVIRTNHGAITVQVALKRAPITATNFLRYVDTGRYDGGNFFRAARTPGHPTEGTIVGTTSHKLQPFPPIAHEPTTVTGLRHITGTISLGRFEPGTARADFFICASPSPYLDAHPGAPGDNLGFAAFGQVVEGISVVHTILGLPSNGFSPFPDQKGEWLKPKVPIISMKRVA